MSNPKQEPASEQSQVPFQINTTTPTKASAQKSATTTALTSKRVSSREGTSNRRDTDQSSSRGSRTPQSNHGTSQGRSSSSRGSNKSSRSSQDKLSKLLKEGRKNILYPRTIQRIFKAIGGISIVKLHEKLLSNQLHFSEMNETKESHSKSPATSGRTTATTSPIPAISGAATLMTGITTDDNAVPPSTTPPTNGETKTNTAQSPSKYTVPKVLNRLKFDALFRDLLSLTTSRHGRWLLDNSHNISRLFYHFDLYHKSHVSGPEFLCTVAALSSGSLEDKLSFCFDVVADSTSHTQINAKQTVMLFRGFTNQGSNWTISEALGQVEQFGTCSL
jgi:hypothetical protein